MNINKDFISKENTYAGANAPIYIVVHETDNRAIGANAQRHAKAQANGNLSTSVHFYSGSDGVYQAADIHDGTYSIGREYGGNHLIKDATNRNSINIEICVNSDGIYEIARHNAIELVKQLMSEYGIPAERVIRHYDAKGKYCPRNMMNNPSLWEDFKHKIGCAIAAEPIKENMIGIVITKHDPLILRDIPNGNKILSMPKGSTLTVLDSSSDWYKVSYEGKIGYCSAKYVGLKRDTDEGGYVAQCTANNVRVRSTPEFGNNIIRKLNAGNLFDVISIDGVWTYINIVGQKGYIYSEFVERV